MRFVTKSEEVRRALLEGLKKAGISSSLARDPVTRPSWVTCSRERSRR